MRAGVTATKPSLQAVSERLPITAKNLGPRNPESCFHSALVTPRNVLNLDHAIGLPQSMLLVLITAAASTSQ